ncbi:MAG: TerC family protein [Flavobacteriales bacterium]|nr:TerC family protein [Flavobacteriales bacterium]
MEVFLQPEAWIALLTLTLLEIVLGIDNIIFISIISNKLPEAQQPKARMIGLSLALIVRVFMLMGISWLIGLTDPLFSLFGMDFSGRNLILLGGGLFLLAKSTTEIHAKMNQMEHEETSSKAKNAFASIIFQIVLLDIVFSFDSILTAVGMSNDLPVMIVAVVIAMIIMMIFAGRISVFINGQPTLQILALSFLILIGFMLIVEGLPLQEIHVPKGYIYFAVFFSLAVEALNMRMRRKKKG